MEKLKVVKVTSDYIEFENGTRLSSEHDQDCCESHYLFFDDLTIDDFEGLEFYLTEGENFFNRVEGYGIELLPIKGFPVRIPGYGANNGYYSSDLRLELYGGGIDKEFDISECQDY